MKTRLALLLLTFSIANIGVACAQTNDSSLSGWGKPLATKDFGYLHVALKSVAEVAPGNGQRGIHVFLEITNRGSRYPLVVAINGEGRNLNAPNATRLRTHLLDDQGGVWNLLPSGLYGLGFVRVGVHGRNGSEAYSPSEVGRLLRLREDLGRDSDDPADGFYANADSCGEGGCNYTFNSRDGNTSPRKFFPFTRNTFIYGSMTSIEPSQSVSVTMTLVPQANGPDYGPLISFQFQSEIVVGVVDASYRRTYSLQNLTFDIASEPAH